MPGDVDDRRLDHVGLFEIGVERAVGEDQGEHRRDLVAGLRVRRDELAQQPRRARARREVAPQLRAQVRRVVPVLERQVDDVERPEAAAPAEDVLRAAVVLLRVEAEALGVVVEREARQRSRRLADVLLRVAVVRTEREQLEELAGEVLVGRLVAGARQVEPDLHRAVAHHGARQRAEVAQRVAAQRALLAHHQLDVADLVVGRRPVVVPVERHPLDQRMTAAHHAVEPPEHVVAVLVDRVQRPPVDARLRPLQRAPRAGAGTRAPARRACACPAGRAAAGRSPHATRASRSSRLHVSPPPSRPFLLARTTSTERIPRAS